MKETFVEIDHSGDVGIEAYGANLSEVLSNLTHGLLALLYRGVVRPVGKRRIRVESRSVEDLFVDWLNEVIAIGGAHGEAFGSVSVTVSGRVAEGVVAGEPFDPARHGARFDVKAATYHDLRFEQTSDGMLARVIFDL